jgi:hypothetical protein
VSLRPEDLRGMDDDIAGHKSCHSKSSSSSAMRDEVRRALARKAGGGAVEKSP